MPTQSGNVLFLIPLPIGGIELTWSIPSMVIDQISKIHCFIVENAKTSRQFLKLVNPAIKWDEIQIFELDKHSIVGQINEIKEILNQNENIGLMSEAGLPCIADPGNLVVKIAHESGIRVKPLTGPSSILLALISSGLNGQNFRFNGYLPSKSDERKAAIQTLEKSCKDCTQLFIEAPYRNDVMFSDLCRILSPEIRLLIAVDITGPNERILCRNIRWWREQPWNIGKVPCMFAIGI